jgi:hypothetical protein
MCAHSCLYLRPILTTMPDNPSTTTSLNALLPQPMSMCAAHVHTRKQTEAPHSVGTFIQVKANDYSFSQIDFQVQEILQQKGDRPVLAIALMPNEGLKSVDQAGRH